MAPGWSSFIIMAILGMGNSEDPIESGILLRHMGEVIVSGDSWTAVATINVEAIKNLLVGVGLLLFQLGNTVNSFSASKTVKDTIKREITVHGNRSLNVASKALLFTNMLPNKSRRRRRKRSQDNIVGLFEKRETRGFAASVSNSKALTILTSIEDKIRRNIDIITNTAISSSDVQVINSGLRTFGAVVEDLDSFLQDILEGMIALSNGKLSPKLVTPSELVNVLRNAKDQFTGSVRPLTELREDDVYAYYTYASVHATANDTSITIYVELPFKADGRVFDLYEPHPFPAYHPTAGVYLEVSRPSELVLVSKLKDKAAEIHSGRVLEECRRRGDTFLCPADITLDDTGFSCTLALILGQEDRAARLCDRKVIPSDFDPRWVRAPNGWYYSVSEPTKILRISEREKVPAVHYLEGTGFLKDEPGTYTKVENGAVLFPADMLGERFQDNKGEVVIPPLAIINLLKKREVDAILRRKKDEEERAGASVSILALLAASERQHDIDRGVLYTALVGAYVFLIMLAFGSRLKAMFLGRFTKREENVHSSINPAEAYMDVPQETSSSTQQDPINSCQKQNVTAEPAEKEKPEKRRKRRVHAKPQSECTSAPKLPPKPALPTNPQQPNEYYSFFSRKKKSTDSAQQLLKC